MTDESIIPALVHPVRDTVASVTWPKETSGLPLPRLASLPHERPMLYGMANVERGVLVVHTTTTLDRLVSAHHTTIFGGDDA